MRARSEWGFTLLEAVLVAALVGLLGLAVLGLYGEGLRGHFAAAKQAELQESARRVLDEIVEGVRTGTARPPGLRAACAVATSEDGLAYRVGNEVVTYYLDGTALKRAVRSFSGALEVVAEGGEQVLGYVVRFAAGGERLISVEIELAANMVRQQAAVRYETKVLPRNWPQ